MDEYLEMKKLALRKTKDMLVDEKFLECMTLEKMETSKFSKKGYKNIRDRI